MFAELTNLNALTFALNSLLIEQYLDDLFSLSGRHWNLRIVRKQNGVIVCFIDFPDVIDIDQIGLMCAKKRFCSQLFLNLRYAV